MRKGLLLCFFALACGSAERPESTPAAFKPIDVGDQAPAYAALTLTGDTVRVGAGQLTLLNVWATWCTSCKEEMADLAALERQYSAKGLRVVAVSVDNGDGNRVRRFVESEWDPLESTCRHASLSIL